MPNVNPMDSVMNARKYDSDGNGWSTWYLALGRYTCLSIANQGSITPAAEGPYSVAAFGVGATVVRSSSTLINVCTSVLTGACTTEVPLGVYTDCRKWTAVCTSSAFIDIVTSDIRPIPQVSWGIREASSAGNALVAGHSLPNSTGWSWRKRG